MNLIENLRWRYATKQFDPSKKVSPKHLEQLKEAIQLSVSSYGLQLYKVLIIENPQLKEELKKASWGQNQITEASHLVIFCNYTKVEGKHIDDFLNLTATLQRVDVNDFNGYGEFIKSKVSEMNASELFNWTHRQTYLALGNLLNACAELKIDACPMEGFEADKYNAILELEDQGLNAAVIATIGYRSSNDQAKNQIKVRKPLSQLFKIL